MAKKPEKKDFPVSEIRRYVEPGPVVLVSSKWRDKANIMTMGWHTVMEFSPSLVGCIIASGNYSFGMIRKAHECVINLPTTALTDIVVKIGNTSGAGMDKFSALNSRRKSGKNCSAADPRMSCQLRMPPSRRQADRQVQFLHLRGGEGACRRFAQASPDPSLHRQWRFHGGRKDNQQEITSGRRCCGSASARKVRAVFG